MTALHLSLSFVAGFLSNQLLVLSAGFFAARAAHAGYFQYFGLDNKEVALGVLSTTTFALPQFMVAIATSFLVARLLRFREKREAVTYLLGAIACAGLYVYSSGFGLAAHLPHEIWQVPAGPYAGWLGILAGIWLHYFYRRIQKRTSHKAVR